MDYNTGDIIIMDNEAKEDKNINKENDQFNQYNEIKTKNNLTFNQLFRKWVKHYFHRREDDEPPSLILPIDNNNNQLHISQIYDIKLNKKLCIRFTFTLLIVVMTFGIYLYAITKRIEEENKVNEKKNNKFDTPLYDNVLFDNSEAITGWITSDRIKNNWCNVTKLPPFPFHHYINVSTSNISNEQLKSIVRTLRSSLTQIDESTGSTTDLLCITPSLMSDKPLNILVFRNGYVFTDIHSIVPPVDGPPRQYYQLHFPCKTNNFNLISVTGYNITIYHSLGKTTILDSEYSRCVSHYYYVNN